MYKRIFDVLISAFGLFILAPVLGVVALLVRLKLGRPILFKQVRPGLNGMPFTLYKFRTMTDKCGLDGKQLPDADRLTSFGKFLRRSSLDELPELWNVIRGDMSLVGPRPLRMHYLPLYSERQKRRHEVRPGITGWAQINGRNAMPWDERFEMDVWYVENHNLLLDLSILARTLWVAFKGDDVAHEGHVTMPPFTGSSST